MSRSPRSCPTSIAAAAAGIVVVTSTRVAADTFEVLVGTGGAGVISALGQLFTGPINYFRGAVTSATSLGALLKAKMDVKNTEQ